MAMMRAIEQAEAQASARPAGSLGY
jgi:hypothetical protein